MRLVRPVAYGRDAPDPPGTLPPMRRLSRPLLFMAVAIGVLYVVRQIGSTRASHRQVGTGTPVIGSLDTWPEVPRASSPAPAGSV